MKPLLSEAKFQKRVLTDLKKLPECYVLKTQERGRHGVPDLLVCLRGNFIAIELKKEGGKTMPLQQHVIYQITQAGGIAFVSRPSLWANHLAILKQR